MSRSLDQVSDLARLGDFFVVNVNLIVNITIFASPYLLTIFGLELTNLTKYALARLAYFGVTCCNFTLVFKAVELNFKDVRIKLLPVFHGRYHLLGFRGVAPAATSAAASNLLLLFLTDSLEHFSSLLAVVAVRVAEASDHVI